MKKVKDIILPIGEVIVLIVAFLLPTIFKLQNLFQTYLATEYLTPGNAIYYLAIKRGNITMGIVIFFLVYGWIRNHNKEVLLNRENVYHNYFYLWYYFCAKILGIKNCNLVNVPIYMQFKLVIHRIFDNYPMEDLDYPEENDQEIRIIEINKKKKNVGNEYNLIIEDTYPIKTSQLPVEKQKIKTIKVSRNNGVDMGRYYNSNFINSVINTARKLPDGIRLNIFATTNPKHTNSIARTAFTMANRGNIKHLYVYQQGRGGDRIFGEKGKKIY